MKVTLFFLLIITISAYLFYVKIIANKQAKAPQKKVKSAEPKPQYRCVFITTGLSACKAAQALSLQPILVNVAPVLPLHACDSMKCDCKFTRYSDRRLDKRRDFLNVARQITGDANNRREKRERRKVQYNYEL